MSSQTVPCTSRLFLTLVALALCHCGGATPGTPIPGTGTTSSADGIYIGTLSFTTTASGPNAAEAECTALIGQETLESQISISYVAGEGTAVAVPSTPCPAIIPAAGGDVMPGTCGSATSNGVGASGSVTGGSVAFAGNTAQISIQYDLRLVDSNDPSNDWDCSESVTGTVTQQMY